MIKSIRLLLPTLLMLGMVVEAHAQFSDITRGVTKTGTTAADFLGIPVGARATAMGGAYSATVDDASAIYWNPAGLANLSEGSFTAEYAQWLQEIDFNYAAVVLPAAGGAFGLSLTALRTGEIEETTEEQQNGTGETFTAGFYSIGVSYGRALTTTFRIGGNVKFISERISNSTASGVAVDIGTLFTTPFRGIRLGASISNFGTKMRMTGDDLLVPVDIAPGQAGNNQSTNGEITTNNFDLPLTMRIGLAGEVYEGENSRITLAVDALSPNNESQSMNIGTEVALLGELVMLRAGYNELFIEDSMRSFALGGGLNYGFGTVNFKLDYAYEAHKYFDAVNRFTLAVGF